MVRFGYGTFFKKHNRLRLPGLGDTELGSEASDEGSLSDHEDEESVTSANEGLAIEPEVVLGETDNWERGELEHIKERAMDSEGLGTDSESFSFEVPTCAIKGLETGPKVSTQDVVEAIMGAGSSAEPILLESKPTRVGSLTEPIFLDSKPTCAGRKRKAKDMSGLTVCFCGEHAKPGDAGSIQCQKAGCATIWVVFRQLQLKLG
ncbi:hypothetical protein F5888DRAFT_1632900 [Russula emetica]|nr:hypothetical protein F5888DRAFT_1632900 [Russula emetica]